MLRCRDEAPGDGVPDDASDCRCLCGSLLARVVEGGVEVKCRRCKRTVLVPLAEPAGQRPRAAGPRNADSVRRAG